MTKPDFSQLDAQALYALYAEVSAEFDADSSSSQWQPRLISGVEYANDVRYEGHATSDEEWAATVRAIADAS